MVDRLRTPFGLVTALGFMLVTFVAIGSLSFPEGPDQAAWSWIGRVILDGGAPYANAWDIKGPLTQYLYATALAVFGRNEFAIRVSDLIAVACSSYILWKLVLRLNGADSIGAHCAVIFFCLVYYTGSYANTAQAEGWGGMTTLATVAALLVAKMRPSVMLLVGVLVALASLIKPTFLIYTLLPLVYCIGAPIAWRGRVRYLAFCYVSFGIVISAGVLLLLITGALRDYLDILIYLYTTYEPLDQPSFFSALLSLPKNVTHYGLLVPYLIAPITLWSMWRKESPQVARLVAVWLVLATVTVVVQRRFWQDHWIPATLASACVLGVFVTYARSFLAHPTRADLWRRVLVPLVFLAAVAPSAKLAIFSNYLWPSYAVGIADRDKYITSLITEFKEDPYGLNYLTLRRVADYISSRSSPQDKLVVWGWDVWIFVMSERKSATRFGFFQALIDEGPLQKKYRKIFVEEVSSVAPKYVVVDTHGSWFLEQGAGVKLLNQFPEFRELLQAHYRRLAVLDVYEIWTRTQ